MFFANIVNNNEKINILINSLSNFFIEGDWSLLKYGTLKHLVKNSNCNSLPDSLICNNKDVYENIPWENMERTKIMRIISRNTNIVQFVDLKRYNFTIEESKYFLMSKPDALHIMGYNVKELNKKEAYTLLTLGVQKFFQEIDASKYDFTAKEAYEILESSSFCENIFNQLNTKNFTDYHISEIIKATKEKFINKLDLKKLTPNKWNEILEEHPHLIVYCDLDIYKEHDIFYTAKLIGIFRDSHLNYLIKERKNYKEELSALGWEKLIIAQEEFINECVFTKLNKGNWNRILYYKPELIVYRD